MYIYIHFMHVFPQNSTHTHTIPYPLCGETLERGRKTSPTPSNTVAAREPGNDGVISYNGGASDGTALVLPLPVDGECKVAATQYQLRSASKQRMQSGGTKKQ